MMCSALCSVLKAPPGQAAGAKRPLPPVTQGQMAAAAGPAMMPGDVMPPELLLRSLQQQQQPSKLGKTAR